MGKLVLKTIITSYYPATFYEQTVKKSFLPFFPAQDMHYLFADWLRVPILTKPHNKLSYQPIPFKVSTGLGFASQPDPVLPLFLAACSPHPTSRTPD
jgi:hypothetical protein